MVHEPLTFLRDLDDIPASYTSSSEALDSFPSRLSAVRAIRGELSVVEMRR